MILPFRRLALGLGLTVAGGLAVWSSFQKPANVQPAKPAEQARATAVPRVADGPVRPKPLPGSRRTASEVSSPDATSAIDAASTAAMEQRPLVPVAFEPTREELELRALIVERQASKQLKTLLGVLDLSEAQQDRIFSSLARHSDYYHPALQFQNTTGETIAAVPVAKLTPTTSSTPSTPAATDPTVDPVLAELDPDQVEVYERYRSERDAFWAGVVDDVEKQLNSNGE
jgi:hypothetical protein